MINFVPLILPILKFKVEALSFTLSGIIDGHITCTDCPKLLTERNLLYINNYTKETICTSCLHKRLNVPSYVENYSLLKN